MSRVRMAAPPYRQVADFLRDKIIDGELSEGAEIPSEREIAEEWGVSRATAAKALGVLSALGLVESTPGVRATVRPLSTDFVDHGDGEERPSPHERHEHMRRTERIRFSGELSTILVHELQVAPADVRDALELDADKQAIRRERVVYRDGSPIELCTSWFRDDLAGPCPKLLDGEHIPEGTTRYVENRLEVAAERVEETDGAVIASTADAMVLRLLPSTPILVTRAKLLTKDDYVLGYEVYRYPGSRMRVHPIPPPVE